MRNKLYNILTNIVTKHTSKVLIGAFIFTLIMFYGASQVKMRNQFSDMMPQDIPQIQSFNNLIKEFTSDAVVMLTIESKSKDVKRMKECADGIKDILKYIPQYTVIENQDLSFFQKINILSGKFPVEGVLYDSINLVKRIDSKLDMDFFKNHGLIIQKSKDIDNFISMYSDLEFGNLLENINNSFEKEFVDDSENLNSLDGETQAIIGLENIFGFINSFSKYIEDKDIESVKESTDKFIFGENYFISSDKTLLLVTITPTVSSSDWDKTIVLSHGLKKKLAPYKKLFPDLEFGLSGVPIIGQEENDAIMEDMGTSSMLAILLILTILLGSFRSWKNPFNSIFVLILAIIWVTGLLGLTLEYLNIMSAMFGIILIGLGIDFGIHILSGLKEGFDEGLNLEKAVRNMYDKVGNGVMTGAFTTALVFLTLMTTGFSVLQEMGFALGLGIIVALIAMFILLPALVIWDKKGHSIIGHFFNRIGLSFIIKIYNFIANVLLNIFTSLPFRLIGNFMQFKFLNRLANFTTKFPIAITVIFISLISMYFAIQAGREIEFEYDMMELEPEGMPAIVNQKKIIDRFEISPDFAMLSVDSEEECRDRIKKIKKLGNRTDIIGRIDGITEFYQSPDNQKENKGKVDKFREKIENSSLGNNVTSENDIIKIISELERLDANIIEIGELSVMSKGENNKIIRKCDDIVGNGTDTKSKILGIISTIKNDNNIIKNLSEFQNLYYNDLKNDLINMSNSEIISLENLPKTIKERYVNKNGDKFLISIFPKTNIWEEKTLRKFSNKTSVIDSEITGMPVVSLLFIDLIGEKGSFATILGAIVIFILLALDFRSIKYTVIAMIPLIIGSIWMVGMMALIGEKFNYNNFMALPIILGIGIDDGVHMLHRYKTEGRFSMPKVISTTGKAILLTSLTTMIGFGSLGLSSHRGMASMGYVLTIGVGTCFLSSVIVLPSIITVIERFRKR